MTEDEVRAEITRLEGEVAERSERLTALRKLLSHPTVTPVLEYFRYGREYREPVLGADTLESAAMTLGFMSDDGQCSAVGVSVGGALIEMDELRERFPQLEDL